MHDLVLVHAHHLKCAERAQVLDTLAEICNLRDHCSEAVDLMRQAIKEDPTTEH